MKALVIGNCQVETFARSADIMCRDVQFVSKEVHTYDLDYEELLKPYHRVFAHLPVAVKIREQLGEGDKIVPIPRLSFAGLHPDNAYVTHKGKRAHSPTGALHSTIAFGAWWHGVDREVAKTLYTSQTFDDLRFSDYFENAKTVLFKEGDECGIDLRPLFQAWMKADDPFMLTMNHPAARPLSELAELVLRNAGLRPVGVSVDPHHSLLRFSIMPVYPEIAARYGVRGSTMFKRDERLPGGSGLFDLESFVDASFDIYGTWDRADVSPHGVMRGAHAEFFKSVLERPKPAVAARGLGPHPYKGIPAHQNWRKAFEGVAAKDVDPVVSSRFRVTGKDKVATAGSCFAQHLAKALHRSGLNYYVAEQGPAEQGYGVYSARYGNVYTTTQLNQLIDRAYGKFAPVDSAWERSDGRFVDPFRPEMPLTRCLSVADVETERAEHFRHVRHMIETMDYFVFTLGLTEAWRSKIDGAVFPIAPGVAAGRMDEEKYEFVNFGVDEVAGDLFSAIHKIREINPGVKVILTVSPVPLMATFEKRHVLVSTTYSKSVLRVAAEMAAAQLPDVYYFPSYEIITGNFNAGAYYDADLRSVRQEGVDHVMGLFLKHCAATERSSADDNQMQEIMAGNDVLCAEEMLDA